MKSEIVSIAVTWSIAIAAPICTAQTNSYHDNAYKTNSYTVNPYVKPVTPQQYHYSQDHQNRVKYGNQLNTGENYANAPKRLEQKRQSRQRHENTRLRQWQYGK